MFLKFLVITWNAFSTFWPLCLAFLATAAFGYFACNLASDVMVQDDILATRWVHFLNGRPNEVGDTLAGFVGSLTLIWVVSSVIQQSMELRAQRAEFAAMTLAQEAQVKALNKQAEIFENEKKSRELDVQEKILDGLLRGLARTCELINDICTFEFDVNPDLYSSMSQEEFHSQDGPHKESAKPFSTHAQLDLDERVYMHSKNLMSFFILIHHENRHLRCSKKVKRRFFEVLPELLDQIADQASNASKAQKIRVASLNLDSMKEHLLQLFKLDLWVESDESVQNP